MLEATLKNMIKAVVKEPGKAPEVREIENSLYGYQKLVEGYIESVPMPGKEDEMDLVMNDEGKMVGLDANIYVPEYRDMFVGTLVVVGVTTDLKWRGLTAEEIEYAKQYLAAHDCESGSTYIEQNEDNSMKGKIQEEIIRDKKHETAVCILDWLSDHEQAEEDLKAYLRIHGYDLRDIL